MKLTPAEIDPTLVRRFQKRLEELEEQTDSFQSRKDTLKTIVHQRKAARTGLNYLALGSAGAITIVSFALCSAVPQLVPWPFASLLALVPFYSHFAGRITRNAEPKLWRAFVESGTFSRVEQAYLGALSSVEQAEEALARPFLTCLSELIVSGRAIEKKQAELAQYHKEVSVESLVAELAALEQRAASASSPEAAATLRQSAAICARRLENRQALALVEERLAAQVEAICQTIASISGTLARAHAAPLGQGASALQQVNQTVAEITQQAQATEAAVQEVLAAGLS